MNRRKFLKTTATTAGILGTTAIMGSDTSIVNELDKGPYCVEIYSPFNLRDRSLPMFDNVKHAQNFAVTRMNHMRSGIDKSVRSMKVDSGKILVTKSNGDVVQVCTWGTGWSQIKSYV
tara:strand:- start:7742 stop:8095 length:354 start_codon:yes stop_codon:yes gene_type:complete